MRLARHALRRTARLRGRDGAVRPDDRGMATAEYAIGTCAAAGFGGLLFKLLTGDGVAGLLESVIGKALSFVF